MKEYSYTLKSNINPDIKVGDKVNLIDGSGLTLNIDQYYHKAKQYFIVNSYPEATGLNETLKDCEATVIKTGIVDKISLGCIYWAYIQDVLIKVGNVEFRTCSQFVTKI